MRSVMLYIAILVFHAIAHAQTSGKIKGYCRNIDQKPLEAVTVSLHHENDSSIIKFSLTDKNGYYEFEKVKPGSYIISCEAVGYKTNRSASVHITENSTDVSVKDIILETGNQTLSSVSVTARRPPIENKIDKTVVNVDASPTNSGLSALEVLEKSPGVTVDNNGNITLKGKQGVVILIDGKPAYLSGEDLVNYLKNMSANQVDQIEIMTQPSAKYDASGNAGIINIKTKKNRNSGFNGNISTSAIFAVYFKNTNSVNMNWRKGKVNLFGNYGYSYWEGFNKLYLDRSSRADRNLPYDRYVEQYTYGRYSGRPQNYKAGIDFFANKNSTIGFVFSGGVQDDKFTSNSTADIYNVKHEFVQYNNAVSETHNPWTNHGFNLNLDQKIDTAGKELTIDADYILYRTRGNQYSNNYLFAWDGTPSEDPYLLNGYLPADIDIYSLKGDYKQPLKKQTTLEAGFKTSYVKTDNTAQYTIFNSSSQKWEPDTSRSNRFIYKENINAAYVNFQSQIKKWGVQLGLRAEQTIADGNQVTKQIGFHRNYTQLFPTAYFTYKPNDSNTVGISFGRRIQRPGYQSLNPFQYQLDRYTYEQGNPNLQPQFSYNYELSYNYKGQVNVSLNYTTTTDIINDVLITKKEPGDSNYTTFQTTENIASNKNIGLSASYNKQLKKWWTINVFANVFDNLYKGVIDNEPINVSGLSFHANMNTQFTLKKGWGTEFSAWFNSRQLYSSAIEGAPMGMFSLGGSKKVLKDKGSIRLNLRDPFYLLHFQGSSDLAKGLTTVKSYWDNRRVIITFNYRFGKTSQQERKRSSAAEDEKNRINTGGQQ